MIKANNQNTAGNINIAPSDSLDIISNTTLFAPLNETADDLDRLIKQKYIQYLQGSKDVDKGDLMNQAKKLAFIRQFSNYQFNYLEEGAHKGYWRGRYKDTNGEIKVFYRNKYADLIDFLYEYYRKGAGAAKGYEQVFYELLDEKRNVDLRAERTIYGWERYYKNYLTGLGELEISEITEDMLKQYISKEIAPKRIKAETMKHLFCVLKNVFVFARQKSYITTYPEVNILYANYRQHADRSKKKDADTYFNVPETEGLREYAEGDKNNPRALILLLCMDTGMRADEPVALHVEDIYDGCIDIHRQQIRIDNPKPYRFVEVDYTKDTRTSENTSRLFPITPRIQEIIDIALTLPGESEYLFHDKNGNMIKKDNYELYLRRVCKKLKIEGKSNNHALRRGFNTNVLIPKNVPVNERAALLGHTVRTNERNYSPKKTDEINKLRDILSEV